MATSGQLAQELWSLTFTFASASISPFSSCFRFCLSYLEYLAPETTPLVHNITHNIYSTPFQLDSAQGSRSTNSCTTRCKPSSELPSPPHSAIQITFDRLHPVIRLRNRTILAGFEDGFPITPNFVAPPSTVRLLLVKAHYHPPKRHIFQVQV